MHYYMIGVLAVSWVFWFWDTYLDYRQYRVYHETKQLPNVLRGKIDDKTFEKSRSYSIDKARFGFLSSLYSQIQSTMVICWFLMPFFWDLSRNIMTTSLGFTNTNTLEWEIFQSLIFSFVTSFASTLVNLPLSIYNTFVIEERHGFNKQTAGFYAWDKFKMFSVSYFISAPVLSAMIYIVRKGGPYFFLYLWVFCFVVVLVLTFFSGEIMAIFDKFSPLKQGELRDKIEAIVKSVKFPMANVYVVEGSKRSAHSNAYLCGIFGKRRVVIYDTLIEGYYDDKESSPTESSKKESSKNSEKDNRNGTKGCTDDEIIAVLCHELGHWSHSHVFKNLAFMEINYFLIFVLFSKFYNDPSLYSAFGFYDERPIVIGFVLMMMILAPYTELQGFISTLISRHFEYQADNYAQKKGYSELLKSALIKLSTDNLGFPVHDDLYSKFNHSHPTLIQRLKELSKKE